MTTKQIRKAYNEKHRGPKMSKAKQTGTSQNRGAGDEGIATRIEVHDKF